MDLKQKAREWLLNYAATTADGPILTETERLADFAAKCVAEEREACAKEMDQLAAKTDGEIADWLHSGAAVIRARKDS